MSGGKIILPDGLAKGPNNGQVKGQAEPQPPIFRIQALDIQLCIMAASQCKAAGQGLADSVTNAFDIVAEVVARYNLGQLGVAVARAEARALEEKRKADDLAAMIPKSGPTVQDASAAHFDPKRQGA